MTLNNAFNVFCLYDKMCFSHTPIATQGRRAGEGEKGGENKEKWGEKNKHPWQENAAEREKKEDKQLIGKKRIVKGGLKREEDENRKHSVCKQQIKNLSALHTNPHPRGYVGLSASYSEHIGK